jgi:RNA polymerase sigma-70 factor (ECF subfamily)
MESPLDKKQILLLQLLEQSGPRLLGMLTRLTLNQDTAEELMQELFIRLFEIKHSENIENLQAYACRTAINLAFDRRRKQRSLAAVPDNQTDLRIPPVDLRLIQAEQLNQVLNAIEHLSGLTRECVVLRYMEQMDDNEIAERIHKNTQQVRGLCSKGIQRIRQILNEQEASFYKESIHE